MTFIKKMNVRSSVILRCYVMVPLVAISTIGIIRTHCISQPVRNIRSVNLIKQTPSAHPLLMSGIWGTIKGYTGSAFSSAASAISGLFSSDRDKPSLWNTP